ncbi:MAG: isoprenylcysteine carboxylmethyltransferase family protein [Desulfatiglandales bacterium]
MIEQVLTILIVFAAPIPWWLVLVHLAVQKKSLFYRFVAYPSLVTAWLLVGYPAFSHQKILFASRFDSNLGLQLLGALLLIVALVIDFQVMKALGLKRLSCLGELQKDSTPVQLVTKGIYRYARHPRYIEYLLWFLGLGLIFGYQFFLWFALYLFLGFWWASYFEEAELVQRFGQAYLDYQKRVPRFFIRLQKN